MNERELLAQRHPDLLRVWRLHTDAQFTSYCEAGRSGGCLTGFVRPGEPFWHNAHGRLSYHLTCVQRLLQESKEPHEGQ